MRRQPLMSLLECISCAANEPVPGRAFARARPRGPLSLCVDFRDARHADDVLAGCVGGLVTFSNTMRCTSSERDGADVGRFLFCVRAMAGSQGRRRSRVPNQAVLGGGNKTVQPGGQTSPQRRASQDSKPSAVIVKSGGVPIPCSAPLCSACCSEWPRGGKARCCRHVVLRKVRR